MEISAKRIKRYMGANLWTQEQLAKAAGVSRATVNNALAKGACSNKTAEKLSKALGVDPVEIMEEE